MRFPSRKSKRRSGMVLIIVLAALALMTVLLLALLRGSSHQMRGAESEAILAREKMLADSAVALVMGQIQQASTQEGQAWISQPGLLRTYDTTRATPVTRRPSACYKLYSATSLEQMTDRSGTLGFLAADLPADWSSTANRHAYTDLNAPQQTAGLLGRPIYPILDPEAVKSVKGMKSDTGRVEMPVAWLYQLQDGSLGPASRGSKENPIVARLAFWTDDETCKININTAGDGSSWNTPYAHSIDDAAWSKTQPAAGEFSRYPGHPATTSLGVVFGEGDHPLSPQQVLGLTPRYAFGGSEFGARTTVPGDGVPPKVDRLYASVDELCFAAAAGGSGTRPPNPAGAGPEEAGRFSRLVETARFVLTAHSQAPEITLRGEPRIAVWPVADDPARTTAADRAIAQAATVGTRNYFFQRHDPLDPRDDFDPLSTAPAAVSNVKLFNELVARGDNELPGYGVHFTQKYPDAPDFMWKQLMLEIADFIRGLNAADAANPAPFTPAAARGFVVPLTASYPPKTALRGLGRCPTLSSLTLVLYVSGFDFDDGTPPVDFEDKPDDPAGTAWRNLLARSSSHWQHIKKEHIRAFVVPCTFQPGCGYPEVSEACDIEITGLDKISLTSPGSNDFVFPSSATSSLQGNLLKTLAPERAWGGNEGPVAWRIAGDAAASGGNGGYPFAGAKELGVSLPSKPKYIAALDFLDWSLAPAPTITLRGPVDLTVRIRDKKGNPLQTLHVSMPQASFPAPTLLGQYGYRDGNTDTVFPSYYMNLKNRLLAAKETRPFLIQPGDATRAVEAASDLRVMAGLAEVPASLFKPHVNYGKVVPQAHNLSFADGVSAYGSSGPTQLVKGLAYPAAEAPVIMGPNWCDGKGSFAYTWYTAPFCSSPTTMPGVTMMPIHNLFGDWDTGPGVAADGALINLPDAGTALPPDAAYFSLSGGQVGAATRRTPNALVPSPVVLGSLPAGIDPVDPTKAEPWRTLLFCPYPAAGSAHPGFDTPPDHLILDNFWMPVVEPYPISTVMTTSGKINLNNKIAPFGYLHRDTPFYALLHDLRIPAIPAKRAKQYKSPDAAIPSVWHQVNEEATVAALAKQDGYLSESEICTVPLVPLSSDDLPVTTLDAFWNGSGGTARLTGDNLRELPYAQLYSRLTTRSNSYTVHVRVQVLQKLRGDPHQDTWNEDTDLIRGDWRGSYEIERYLDPAAKAPEAGRPLRGYRFRIVSSHRFAPS